MKIDILTIFPDMFSTPFESSIIKRAREKEIVNIVIHNIRDFSTNKHKKVDDYPYGGGAGMVMRPEPIFAALEHLGCDKDTEIIILSPQGSQFTQAEATKLSQKDRLILLCGHYEGIDHRVYEYFNAREISIGDYVLTGGEIPAMVITDAIVRLIPGALGKEESHINDSFQDGLLEHPHYTRPQEYRGLTVPDVLLSGNHQEIENWRRVKSIENTQKKRPDLLKNKPNT